MLDKTVHFINVNLPEEIPTQGYPKMSEAAVPTCTTKQFFKILQNSQELICNGVFSQPATFNFIEKETPSDIAFCEFYEFKTPPANWFLKNNFTKNGEPTLLL